MSRESHRTKDGEFRETGFRVEPRGEVTVQIRVGFDQLVRHVLRDDRREFGDVLGGGGGSGHVVPSCLGQERAVTRRPQRTWLDEVLADRSCLIDEGLKVVRGVLEDRAGHGGGLAGSVDDRSAGCRLGLRQSCCLQLQVPFSDAESARRVHHDGQRGGRRG